MSRLKKGPSADGAKNRRAMIWLVAGVIVLAVAFVGLKVVHKSGSGSSPSVPAAVAVTPTTVAPVVHRSTPQGPQPDYSRNPFASAN